MANEEFSNMLACLDAPDEYLRSELYIADSILRRLSRGDVKLLSLTVNRVRENTAFELYRIDGPERQGYLLQVPVDKRPTTRRVESILSEGDANVKTETQET